MEWLAGWLGLSGVKLGWRLVWNPITVLILMTIFSAAYGAVQKWAGHTAGVADGKIEMQKRVEEAVAAYRKEVAELNRVLERQTADSSKVRETVFGEVMAALKPIAERAGDSCVVSKEIAAQLAKIKVAPK